MSFLKKLWSNLALNLLVLPTIFLMSLKNWITMWMMMEINSLSLIYWLAYYKKEPLMMLFIFQTLSSIGVFLVSTMQKPIFVSSEMFNLMSTTMLMSLSVKFGFFPFHKWMTHISKHMSWMNNLIMMTLQKMIPMLLIMKLLIKTIKLNMIIISLMILSLALMFKTLLKPLLMVSSITHSSVMLTPVYSQPLISVMYLSMYSIVLITMISYLTKNILNSTMVSTGMKSMMMIMVMSMVGVPPFTGFFCKWIIFKTMMEQKFQMMIFLPLTLSSCLAFYIYMSICYKTMINYKKNWKTLKNPTNTFTWSMMMTNILFFVCF